MRSTWLQAEQDWDQTWADGARFGLCFAFHSFCLQWKPLTWDMGTHINTPNAAPGPEGVAGALAQRRMELRDLCMMQEPPPFGHE